MIALACAIVVPVGTMSLLAGIARAATVVADTVEPSLPGDGAAAPIAVRGPARLSALAGKDDIAWASVHRDPPRAVHPKIRAKRTKLASDGTL